MKAQMGNLRSNYGKERRRATTLSGKSGSGSKDVSSQWQFYAEINSFLAPHYTPNKSLSNLEGSQQGEESEEDDADQYLSEEDDEFLGKPPTKKFKPRATKGKATNPSSHASDQLLYKCVEKIGQIDSRPATPVPVVPALPETSEDLFGKLVAQGLKKISDDLFGSTRNSKFRICFFVRSFPTHRKQHSVPRGWIPIQ